MAIVFESASSTGAASTTIGVPAPSGLSDGDLMIAAVYARQGGQTGHGGLTTPGDGWTKIQGSTDYGGAAEMDFAVFWKIANATNASASSFTFRTPDLASPSMTVGMSRWTGHNSSSPIDVSMVEPDTQRSSGTHAIEGTMTPSHSSAVIVLLAAGNDNTLDVQNPLIDTDNPTWSSGYRNTYSLAPGDAETNMWYALRPENSATSSGSYVVKTNDAASAIMLFIEPPDGAAGGGGKTRTWVGATLGAGRF